MSYTRYDHQYEMSGSGRETDWHGDDWKTGEGPRKANFGHSVLGWGGAIHFDHRGNQLPTRRHTPRLLNLLNGNRRIGDAINQRDVDEYRIKRDAGLDTGWLGNEIKDVVSRHFTNEYDDDGELSWGPEDRLRQARMVSGGDPTGVGWVHATTWK